MKRRLSYFFIVCLPIISIIMCRKISFAKTINWNQTITVPSDVYELELAKIKDRTKIRIEISNIKIKTLNYHEDSDSYSEDEIPGYIELSWMKESYENENKKIYASNPETFCTTIDENFSSFYCCFCPLKEGISVHGSFDIKISKVPIKRSIKLNANRKTIRIIGDEDISGELKASLEGISADDIKWKSSNSKIAYVEAFSGKKAYLYAHKPGKCTITCYYKNIKAVCKVNVVRSKKLSILSTDWGYDTRSNKFYFKIKNIGKYPITILRKRGKALDDDYASYDRFVIPTKKIKIKPGKSKYVFLKVLGSNTWPDISDFTVCFYLKHRGKTRKILVNEDIIK